MAVPKKPSLSALVKRRMNRAVPPAVQTLADAARARHDQAVAGVLAYGSCLRGVDVADTLVDLYVLVFDYGAAHKNPVASLANRLLPPNVYYLECPFEDGVVRGKYAVIDLDQFAQKTSAGTDNPYFWARFAQPSVLVWAQDAAAKKRIENALCASVTTFLNNAAPLCPPGSTFEKLWQRGLEETYATELRSEALSRPAEIISADPDFFAQSAQAVFGAGPARLNAGGKNARAGRVWARRRVIGKLLSGLRLMKAAFTFQGGAEYIAWKIRRHSGVDIDLKPWHHRHPIIAGLILLPKLFVKKAVR